MFIPPNIDAKANGISIAEEFHSIFLLIPKAIGNSIAIAPILFINEERIAAVRQINI